MYIVTATGTDILKVRDNKYQQLTNRSKSAKQEKSIPKHLARRFSYLGPKLLNCLIKSLSTKK